MEPNSSDRSIMPTVWALGSGLLAASTTLGLIFLVSNGAKSQLQLFVGGVALVAWVIFILVLMSALRGNGAKQGFLVGGPATRLILAILVIGVSAIALIGTPIVMSAAYFGVPFQLGYSGGIRRGDQIGRLAFLLLSSLVPMLAAALVLIQA